MSSPNLQSESRWPHRLAVLLVWTTFPLIWVGGLVTTTKAGMAVPDWPSTYGYNLFLYPWTTWLLGPWDLFIEHGHRLLASLVGMITIAFLIAVLLRDGRRWLRVLAVVALLAVVGQGALGGMRVLLDARTLAKIHGCVGPAFFALCVALAVMTSKLWRGNTPRRQHAESPKLHRLALITTLLAYVQLVLGAELRHISVFAPPGEFRAAVFFHLLIALVLLLHVVLLAARVLRFHRDQTALARPASCLLGLIVLQLALGAGTWVVKYAWPGWVANYQWAAAYTILADSYIQALIITAHVATGSLILAVSLLIALRSLRLYRGQPRPMPEGYAPTNEVTA
jgi:cytochrome c oxidase assembly protein subunit 15